MGKSLRLAATLTVAMAFSGAVAPAVAQESAVPPMLQVDPHCDEFAANGFSGVRITATVDPPIPEPDPGGPGGIDPNAVPRIEASPTTSDLQFVGLAEGVGGLVTSGSVVYLWTDETGLAVNAFGSQNPNTYTASIYWAGGVVTESLFVDCAAEGRDRCTDGGWRELGFRNYGQCVRWMKRADRRVAPTRFTRARLRTAWSAR